MSDHLPPLEVAERLIGPKPDLERIAGYQRTAAYAWERSSKTRPAGYLPVAVQRKFLDHCRLRGIPAQISHHGRAYTWLIEGAPIEAVHGALDEMKARAA